MASAISAQGAAAGGFAACGFVTVLLAPLLAIGYGAPLFDVPVRPGLLGTFGAESINGDVGLGISYALVANVVVGYRIRR